MKIEDKYADVLQNVEFAVVHTYRSHPGMSDYSVMRALEALLDAYAGERIGRPPRGFSLSDLERSLLAKMREMCEWRLGRGELPVSGSSRALSPGPEPIGTEEIILCLKRILKSVQRWNKEGGTQGYLTFIAQFVR